MTVVTRFAPSPTGYLHLGHAYSALFAAQAAHDAGGRFLLRIEDIDPGRCRSEFDTAISEDLAWLGLAWETPVRRQSEHLPDYQAALDRLAGGGLIYPCFCTRKDIADEIAAAGGAPQGPDGPVYPGICRTIAAGERRERVATGQAHALRLDMAAACRRAGPLSWQDDSRGKIAARPERFGDIVLARKEVPTSYHLSVTVDDALQGVTLVTRGEDLNDATDIHRLLQALLGLPTPLYRHHRLLTDTRGRRLAKRDRAATIRSLREAGRTPAEVRALTGLAAT
ncbi:MAG: tRNA glutamyl-Q(34) synthetase GluQRS [Proteobacteria bacterium]|nr:tRNA glutamyl-Q(34) synthetase GluQRS [Pseudomonadota bacterium]